ncbi:hypothetical protein PG993_014971 [Apiospora rasikravindrae]|uniref:Fungal-type protein kinase domain-containing protein n=1 Tax=Apiospora rasikravindrae TaxID=990691 RepID=A0ABR1RPK1_9PEZI
MGSSSDESNSEKNFQSEPKRCQSNFITSDQAWSEIERDVFSGAKTQPITVNRLFCLPEPILSNEESASKDTQSWNNSFMEVSEAHVSAWDAFNDENVDIMFGDFLDERLQHIPNPNLMAIHFNSHRESANGNRVVFSIEDEGDLNRMMEKAAIIDLLDDAFALAAKEFQERVNAPAPGKLGTSFEAKRIIIHRDSYMHKSSETIPDWLFCPTPESASGQHTSALRRALMYARKQNLVPGPGEYEQWEPDPNGGPTLADVLSKYAGKGIDVAVVGEAKQKDVFDPANLANIDMFPQVRSTLGQMLMYCRWSKTRYAFVATSEEVTFLRFFRLDDTEDEKEQFGVNYAVLPWKREPGNLSVWKGIWALVMLGLHNKYRSIVPEDQIRDLNSWSRLTNKDKDQGQWENHLSKRVVDDGYWAQRSRGVEASTAESATQLDRQEAGKSPGLLSKRPGSDTTAVERSPKVVKSEKNSKG